MKSNDEYPFTCDDKPTLIAYLYGEVDAATRHRVDAHLATCERCAAEVTALGDVRAELGLWAPPDAELGFSITRKSEPQSRNGAAAGAVVEHRAGVGASRRRRAGDRRRRGHRESAGAHPVRTASRSAPAGCSLPRPVAAPAQARATKNGARRWSRSNNSCATEIRSTHEQTTVRAAAPSADEATIRRVQQMLAASEERQQRELALRLTQFTVDMNMQRRADLMKITNSFGQFGDQMMQQRQMLNNVIRVSATGQQ